MSRGKRLVLVTALLGVVTAHVGCRSSDVQPIPQDSERGDRTDSGTRAPVDIEKTPIGAGDAGNDSRSSMSPVAKAGGEETLDVGSWNIEWFGSLQEGPADETLQARRVRETVEGSHVDAWGFQEVVDGERFKTTIESVPGYRALVGSDSIVEGGSASYKTDQQKVAFAYNSNVIRVVRAGVLLRESSFNFAGRPPLEVQAVYEAPDGRAVPITFVVMHLKAGNDASAWDRRQGSIAALKAILDARAQAEAIFLIGDWNDELVRSKVKGRGSPFAALVEDVSRYAFPTLSFGAGGISTMVTSRFANDQHVVSIAASAFYVPESAVALRLDRVFEAYGDTTSDHFPVVSRYRP